MYVCNCFIYVIFLNSSDNYFKGFNAFIVNTRDLMFYHN